MAPQKRFSLMLASSLSGAKDTSPEAQATWYRMMQETQPLRYQPEYDLWEVFLYDDIQHVLTDYTTFSAEIAMEGFPEARNFNTDPPDHRYYRTIVGKAFTPRRIAQLEPRITAIVDEILERHSSTGKLDIVEDLAYPLPIRVIGEMLGVPMKDQERFRLWSYQLIGLIPNTTEQAGEELQTYFNDLLSQRRQEPQDDLMSALLEAEQDGQRLSLEDVISICIGLLIAGNVTTTVLLSLAARRFAKNPEIFQQLRQDPSLIPGAIEEILRHDFAHGSFMRIARHDTTLRGHEIKAGQLMLVWLSSANFDEKQFPHAQQFDIRRYPNQHLSFGYGMHFCLGAPLARFEGKIALERMVAHWSDLRQDPELAPQYVNAKVDVMQKFPVIFTPV